jgi:hypothetical protein
MSESTTTPSVPATSTTPPPATVTSPTISHTSGIPTRPMSSGYRHDGHHDYHYRRPYYHRPIYYGGYYPRYYEDGWWYNRPSTVYVTEETKKEEFNMLPIYVIGGISVLALLVALQKK